MVVSAPAVARRCRQLPSSIKPSTSIQTRFRAHSFTCADANSSPPARLLSTSLILSSTPQWEFSETCLSQARHAHSHNSCTSHYFFQPRFTSLKRLHSYNLVSTISSSSSTQTPTSPTTKAAVTNTTTNAVDATVSEDSADESPTLAAQCLKPHSPNPLPRLVMPQSNPQMMAMVLGTCCRSQ